MRLILVGPPGSGKGTQSAWLSSRLGIPSLSTGEILRAEAQRNTPAAYRLRQVLGSGSLVSDEMVCAVTPQPFHAVGLWYDDFSQTTDDEVRELLAEASRS